VGSFQRDRVRLPRPENHIARNAGLSLLWMLCIELMARSAEMAMLAFSALSPLVFPLFSLPRFSIPSLSTGGMMRSYSFAVATAAFSRPIPRTRVRSSSTSSCRKYHTCITRPFITIERSGAVIKYINNSQNCNNQPLTRLFGSNPKSANAKPGYINLSDDRDPPNPTLTPIDLGALHRTIEITREIIGYPTYDVSVCLVDDTYMSEINKTTRNMDKPTDVLSFCFQESFIQPGVLGEVQFDISDYYNLGDMLIDVEYVKRKCDEDRMAHSSNKSGDNGVAAALGDDDNNDGGRMIEGEVLSETNDKRSDVPEEEDDDDDQYEYEYIEVEVDEYDDRGVAPAMQYIYDPEIRIHMLVVHGMLHLVGYDHIEEDDYELMVIREDEVLAELKHRLGDNFGLNKGKALSDGR
jgi:rRNA maturation RNase YbeY